MNPVLKWPGSKRQLLQTLVDTIPVELVQDRDVAFVEPFMGSGALFFGLPAVHARRWVLGDVNTHLMNFYVQLRDRPEEVIAAATTLQDANRTEQGYYQVRATVPDSLVDQAARVLFLNKMAFNGIWRESAAGGHNVPYNQRPQTLVVDVAALLEASARLKQATLVAGNFEDVCETIAPKKPRRPTSKLVYLDPPYIPISATANFAKYSRRGFSLLDQRRLASLVERLVAQGHHVILSNSDCPATHAVFDDVFKEGSCTRVEVQRSVSARAASRTKAAEVLYTSFRR